MKRPVYSIWIIVLTALGALAGAALRVYQLTRCTNEVGLIVPGSRIMYVLLGFVVVGLAVAAYLCTRLNKARGSERCFVSSPVFLFCDLAAAILVFFGSLLRLLDGDTTALYVGGMVSAVCLAAAALLYGRQSKLSFWLLLLPCVFLAGQLILDFKGWSSDPLVLDFCFRLLAQVCAMLALFQFSGFLLQYGRKRMSVFWSIGAVVFTAMSLPDYFLRGNVSAGAMLLLGGMALLCASHALRVLRPAVQQEPTAAQPPDEGTA